MKHSIQARVALFLILAGMTVAANAQVESVEVQNLAQRWVTAYNTHDEEALGELYMPDARLMVQGGPTLVGRQRIQEYWAQDFKKDQPLTVLNTTHAVTGEDMTLVHGNYQVINRADGRLLGQGRFAHIWVLDDEGNWRLFVDLWNEPFDPYPAD